jgi:hypothetical protein
MLTGRRNYRLASDMLDEDFIANPERVKQFPHCLDILVYGMLLGWFTNKALGDYIAVGKQDFVNARRVVNGTDRAREIAQIAEHYLDALVAMREAVHLSPEPSPSEKEPDMTDRWNPPYPVPSNPHVSPIAAYGAGATAIWTLLQVFQVLPTHVLTPEASSLATGAIVTLASVIGGLFERRRVAKHNGTEGQ